MGVEGIAYERMPDGGDADGDAPSAYREAAAPEFEAPSDFDLTVDGSDLVLAWQPPAGAHHVEVWRKAPGETAEGMYQVLTVAERTFTDRALRQGVYEYSIVAAKDDADRVTSSAGPKAASPGVEICMSSSAPGDGAVQVVALTHDPRYPYKMARTIGGSGLAYPRAVAYDPELDEIYVANGNLSAGGASTIVAYPRAASGTVAPRTLRLPHLGSEQEPRPKALAYDAVNREIVAVYATTSPYLVAAFPRAFPVDTAGEGVPRWYLSSLHGASMVTPNAVAVDGESIFVANNHPSLGTSRFRRSDALSAPGAPSTKIESPSNAAVSALALDPADGLLFMANRAAATISTYDTAAGAFVRTTSATSSVLTNALGIAFARDALYVLNNLSGVGTVNVFAVDTESTANPQPQIVGAAIDNVTGLTICN
jgi:DNA-binding beta-propeller fold protein YncE